VGRVRFKLFYNCMDGPEGRDWSGACCPVCTAQEPHLPLDLSRDNFRSFENGGRTQKFCLDINKYNADSKGLTSLNPSGKAHELHHVTDLMVCCF
jgi:hypothetical protein